jgi:hypothetical protein
MPSVSPEKPPPVIRVDESWEQPGQEGEISLVASSTTSGIVDEEELIRVYIMRRKGRWKGIRGMERLSSFHRH